MLDSSLGVWKLPGCLAFLHPEGVYNDPAGGRLRKALYKRLRKHFQLQNEKKYFPIGHRERFSINIYSNVTGYTFDTIANLIDVTTVDQCYNSRPVGDVPGIKDDSGSWDVKGHPDRILTISAKELATFARMFDSSDDFAIARLPALHARQFIWVLELFDAQEKRLADLGEAVFSTVMWDETNAQRAGRIARDTALLMLP